MKYRVSEHERPQVSRFALVFASIVVTWATLHDIHLISVEPKHFTEYHPVLLPITNHILLAIQYATIATFGPALVFGFLAYFACRFGAKKKVELKRASLAYIVIISIIEIILLSVGYYARSQFELGHGTIYPSILYPELSPGLVFTQSVNISAYLLAPFLSALYLIVIYLKRKPTEPNQALEPTPVLVTDRACARSAPSTGVAQLER